MKAAYWPLTNEIKTSPGELLEESVVDLKEKLTIDQNYIVDMYLKCRLYIDHK